MLLSELVQEGGASLSGSLRGPRAIAVTPLVSHVLILGWLGLGRQTRKMRYVVVTQTNLNLNRGHKSEEVGFLPLPLHFGMSSLFGALGGSSLWCTPALGL